MAHPLYVAFIWHQHQPLYKRRGSASGSSAQYRLPWVRRHGTKDYLDLVMLLERYPKLHQTVNLARSPESPRSPVRGASGWIGG